MKTGLAALRHLRRGYLATLPAALSLALGMALATAMVSMVEALFLRPLPFPAQERLVRLYQFNTRTQRPKDAIFARHAAAIHGDLRTLEAVGTALFLGSGVVLGESGTATRSEAARITPGFFDVLGVHPLLGRPFDESDAVEGLQHVIIAHSVWQSRFGGASDILERTILIDGLPASVVGVMPSGFDYPRETDIWLPLSIASIRADAARMPDPFPRYFSIGRTAPGATREQASAELSTLYRSADREASADSEIQSRFVSLSADANAQYRQQLSIWIAAAIVIALLCAVNFATLTLARGMRRKGELALRLAIGASPRQIVSLLVAESAVVATVGGVIATLLGAWLLAARHVWFTSSALPVEPVLGWRLVAFGLLASFAIGILFALGPAIELARTDVRSLISGGNAATAGKRELRGRRGLVALQLGMSLAAIAVVVALASAVREQRQRGPGYDYAGVLTADVFLRSPQSAQASERALLDFVRGFPGVREAAIARLPDGHASWLRPDSIGHRGMALQRLDVSDGYFATTGVRAVAGRLPTAAEIAGREKVVVLSTSTGRWIFGDVDPLGHQLGISAQGQKQPTWYTVIGIVPDIRYGPRFEPLSPPVYTLQSLPIAQSNARLLIRFDGDARTQVAPMRSALANVSGDVIVTDVRAVTSDVEAWMERSGGRVGFFLAVAVLAVVLAIIGVYGLTSYTAELRAREIGIRLALGATRARISALMLADLGWVIVPAAIGGTLLGSRVVGMIDTALREPLLPQSVLVFQVLPAIIAVIGLVVVVLAGTLIPATRAFRTDIARVLHHG